MPQHVIIDGNNLLHAVHAQADRAHVGRESLAKLINQWSSRVDTPRVTLVYDGGPPPPGLVQQMTSPRVTVRFSRSETADDVIIRMIDEARHPTDLRIISTDSVIRHAAKYRRCESSTSEAFVPDLFLANTSAPEKASENPMPKTPPRRDTKKWLDTFGIDDEDEPFDGYSAMTDQ